jgi:phytoene dehydrogenase-like protein
MEYEVVVVGGGIGGLTVAALLAARGVSVCLFERQSQPGGCVANFEFQGYTFEPASGLYTGWEPRGIHERIFSELPVQPPEVRRLTPAYVVRLPDHADVEVSGQQQNFEENLRATFPECADAAVSFYRKLDQVARTWLEENNHQRQFASKSSVDASTLLNLAADTAAAHFRDTSLRFQTFIDAQLQTFDLCAAGRCSYISAAISLTAPNRGMWAICGGAQTLADKLAESLRTSGGSLRLNSSALRLAYASDGAAIGVDLLSGERVIATRAIISNLTIWDTYGRLVGLSRTPASISAQLKLLQGCGAYMLFLGMDQPAGGRLGVDHLILVNDWQQARATETESNLMMFAAAPEWDPRAPEGKRAVTVWTSAGVSDWFAFHQDETAHEEQDQATLERLWPHLHAAMPELGDGIEVIESATPRTFHETTRRKLGMVGGLCSTPARMASQAFGTTIFPNLFLVGDTASPGNGVEAVSRSALSLAEALASRG